MKDRMFSNRQIAALILPLILEQFLAVMVGMADTIMIARAGAAAVSGISVVDCINVLLIGVFTALATGGAVVASHYLGEGKQDKANRAANQLILTGFLIAGLIAVLSILFNRIILKVIYGNLDEQVMSYARTYFYITAVSFPFLAVYNGAAAICRSMGNSRISLLVSLIMNLINVTGNAILIFGFHMEVTGAALSTLTARVTAAIIMVCIVRNQKLPLHINGNLRLGFDPYLIRKILNIGIPVALESGLFQGGKLMVAGLISSFGTDSITANAISNTIASFQTIPGTAIGLAVITIVGQSLGAKHYEEAKDYIKKMVGLAILAHLLLCIPMTLFLPEIISYYHMSPTISHMAWVICMIHGISCVVIWPFAFTLPNALRAAGDASYTMWVTILSMFIVRIGMSFVLGRDLNMGVIGVWIAMILDWVSRAIFFTLRIVNGKWIKKEDTV